MHHSICAINRLGQRWRCIMLPLLMAASFATHAAELSLSVADIVAPAFSARGITLILPENGSADLRVAELHVQQREMRNVQLHCATLELSTAQVSCRGGSLDGLPGLSLEFGYRFASGAWRVVAQLRDTPVKRFAAYLPKEMPLPAQGSLNGSLRLSGTASGAESFDAELRLADVGFSDSSGLHAAEKLRGAIGFSATRKAGLWNWQGDVAWQSGELFWQPLYLRAAGCGALPAQPAGSTAACRGGYQLSASGSFDGAHFNVEQARADLPEVGRVQFAAQWDMQRGALTAGALHGDRLALGRLFADYAKPFLDKGVLSESALSGHADVDWRYRNGATQSLRLRLHDAGIADAAQRFAIRGVNSAIDWQVEAPGSAAIAFAGGTLLGVPLGAGQWDVQMHGMEFGVAQATLPVLDGKLELRDFRLRRAAGKPCGGCEQGGAWHWQFSGALSGISMERFSQAAGMPRMLGTLAGRIPRVSYDGAEIKAEGALLFNVFDGTVVATQLRLSDPFGRAPRLSGNLNMRELDLDLLTRTFSFGNMQGRIDVDVNDLQLQDWQPVRFDARVSSSAGNYPRKISQKAVQNISALGGAGAAAAIQRSYLRFFENFGYERIGWRCMLRNGVCAMGGVDDGSGMSYILIKGGGIPAISVMGYNRAVSWRELTARLKRVLQDNVQPIVK